MSGVGFKYCFDSFDCLDLDGGFAFNYMIYLFLISFSEQLPTVSRHYRNLKIKGKTNRQSFFSRFSRFCKVKILHAVQKINGITIYSEM